MVKSDGNKWIQNYKNKYLNKTKISRAFHKDYAKYHCAFNYVIKIEFELISQFHTHI